ncbi:hypothetical protein [Actinophytocola xanthii]|uniref:Uncharacterized protein n=1 Tax=Actinophytocola xanthii TaxID=1912961 RepID=A0A1Q8CWL0_9PSEU|nr:hypothetical protein [Actinophytocola xanthii]OLF18737.1 hypothetical protein BU204_04300 [Actinophytocola xanthii]
MSPRRRPPVAARTSPRRRRWRLPVALLALGLLGAFLWPSLTLLFSPVRPVVAALDQDVVYVEPGAGAVDVEGVRREIDERPLVMVVLRADSPLAEDPGETCTGVSDRIEGVLVAVVAGAEFEYGCENDIPLNVDEFGWDYAQWSTYGQATGFLDGDVVAQAAQLAARYDAEVVRGRLDHEPRTLAAPVSRYVLAASLVVLVVGGVLFVYKGLDRVVQGVARRRAERGRWRARRDELDAALGEVALIMLDLAPGGSRARAAKLAKLSEDYLLALADWTQARPGTELDGLDTRVAALRRRALALEDA